MEMGDMRYLAVRRVRLALLLNIDKVLSDHIGLSETFLHFRCQKTTTRCYDLRITSSGHSYKLIVRMI